MEELKKLVRILSEKLPTTRESKGMPCPYASHKFINLPCIYEMKTGKIPTRIDCYLCENKKEIRS